MKRAFFTGKYRNGEHTAIDVQPWVDKMIAKNAFGKPDRWERHEEPPVGYTDTRQYLIHEALPEREVPEYDIEGNLTGGTLTLPAEPALYGTEYFYPSEYSYVIEDITAEHAAKEQKKADREAAKEWLKTNKSSIMSLPELNEAFDKLLESLGY